MFWIKNWTKLNQKKCSTKNCVFVCCLLKNKNEKQKMVVSHHKKWNLKISYRSILTAYEFYLNKSLSTHGYYCGDKSPLMLLCLSVRCYFEISFLHVKLYNGNLSSYNKKKSKPVTLSFMGFFRAYRVVRSSPTEPLA